MFTTKKTGILFVSAVFLACMLLALVSGCSKEPAWKAVNDQVIKEHNVQERVRTDIVENNIVSNLEPGVVTNLSKLPETEIAPGAKGKIYWGKGNLMNWMTLEPGAEIPKETLSGERIMVVWEGSVEQLINGSMVKMIAIPRTPIHGTNGIEPRRDFVYLEKGAENAVKAGPQGAKILEVYWPVRLDYMKKAGSTKVPSSVPEGNYPIKPSVMPNKVYDYYDIQFTELVPGANSRLITGRGAQLSFLRMDPGSYFPHHNHPEEQVMIVIRGAIDEIILDHTSMMKKDDALLLPADLVHGGTNQPEGCDVLDVFWPPRPDYNASMEKRLAAYHAIIPEDAKVELVADGAVQGPGLTFGEGPSWMNGKLYFSSMFFSSDWGGDPAKSALVEMDPDGTYRYISQGKMQTNGTMPLGNGNLAVCDMFGHRVIEMTTTGKVVRVLASSYGGKRLDGPNDLVVDAKGGIYFTDPQFIPDERQQPGRSIYYRKKSGELIRVIDPDVFAMPNGVLLSPDGKTLYVNNTYDNEEWWNVNTDKDNFLWAYDVNDDGTVSNGRKFAELYLTPDVLDRKGKSTSADGMTIDVQGNVYVATQIGIQIVSAKGEFIGIINFPVMPVSCCFGGDDYKTIYATCYDKVYKIRTNMKGLEYPLKP
ncbi:MAG: SMP-30/gluconolactonase/LRE family protein [Candidatus Latescibacteria bacterium]|nr:SMP-30/gluconolactonase/LRE family protein [Candidatus Latescibacterota bacterium]